ncbi:MAG: asparagine--tRNA ligase, partial [Clostridiales bacterium]|nr:asparagine--tRNA ligase [Clostridiales bacterium]
MDLRELYLKSAESVGSEVCLEGWIRNHRKQKNIGFIDFFDGTCFKSIQLVYDDNNPDFEKIQTLHVGAAIGAKGTVVENNDKIEINVKTIELLGECPEDYPLQPKRHSIEFLREIAYLRPRTRIFQAVFRIRSIASMAIHEYFQDNGYVYVHTPIFTANDAEGAGNTFTVTSLDPTSDKFDYADDFFGKPTSLAVTGQLEGETFALAFNKIYTFGPT